MNLTRRAFSGGSLSAALGGQLAVPALAQARPDITAAVAAIQRYGEAHRSYFNLPGMTLGLVTPEGQRRWRSLGWDR